jgi:hypothetical protein
MDSAPCSYSFFKLIIEYALDEKKTVYHEVWTLLLSAVELVVDIMKRGPRHLSTLHQIRILQQKLVLRQKVLENLYRLQCALLFE